MRWLSAHMGIIILSLVMVLSINAVDDKQSGASLADELLKDVPLTIIFRKILVSPRIDTPSVWEWSINSAGEGELTISYSKPKRQKVTISAEQLKAIRNVLRMERFVELENGYGPHKIHGGWSTLTVIAGEQINKTVRFHSTWSWSDLDNSQLAKAAPAGRIWLKITEIVDPEGTIFEERKYLAAAIKAVK